MIIPFQSFLFPLLLAGGILAQESPQPTSMPETGKTSESKTPMPEAERSNEFFFQPVLTLISLSTDKIPLILSATLEHHLADGKSLIWQPQIVAGTIKDTTTKFTEYAFGSYLGLRNYFNGELHRGFYIQGSVAAQLGNVKAERIGYTDNATAFVQVYAALGYLGYKWKHVFLDLGVGYQKVSGTLKFNTGEEVEVSATGPTLDANLGFTF